ncbi:RNA polymerase sigma factor SigJ [Dactylosporangium matsuzakiense]|uniref:RNA polymerase sigma24 factor n=1 Tax=Dactylosporangium matsuzakiense TaxID=53360 RepID=A0A9W6KG31_9ACTN|nr:RNA polymerase sigma factor SigJ [Dactylosporangium matsuzakiense]UWZ47365.1 RNA polymerase sigma factor SigJ [Dactylosporangium matsuzakiense]GLL01427.1 RNA polymerase sigma24 factor [Dactylosporangium matsuzakiense]
MPDEFSEHRELLFSVVYNILGTVADTEDVLQETWLAWTRRTGEPVEHPRAYLVRMAVNRALGQRAAISRRQETYIGPWLPEPIVDAPDAAVRAESVSMALLVVLETLTPLERAVFVLHEVFGYPHTEIAEILDRTAASVRQVAHRAREHVQARRPRYEPDPQVQQQVTERFLAAALGGDLDRLMEILAPDVTLWGDSGGQAHGGRRPMQGVDKVARLIVALHTRPGDALRVVYRRTNGDPSALLLLGDTPYAVVVLDLTPERDRVAGIYVVANTEKLSHVG